MKKLKCFKAYDIRGQIPNDLNEDVVYKIGRAYAEFLQPKKVVVGYDIRLSSPALKKALVKGLLDSGIDVYDIGLCGTEEIYFATFHYQMDGGIMITASHNPMDYNGLKLVRENARPISGDTGLFAVHDLVLKNQFSESKQQGKLFNLQHRQNYIHHLLTYIDVKQLKPLRIAVDPGNGGAGLILQELENILPLELIKVNFEVDGNFPNGIPNPLLIEQRKAIINAVKTHQADVGLAWDGDFDRCFFIDETGRFIEGYYIVGLLAEAFLQKEGGAKIIHDPRLTWNSIDVIANNAGKAVQSKTGHAFIKEKMREEDAIYGGEMSAHHYFRDFAYCDSGMIPWLLVLELICRKKQPLSTLLNERMKAYPCSGEINFRVKAVSTVLAGIKKVYFPHALTFDTTDGMSFEFDTWRFNIRSSNTEPLLRLNVESKGDKTLMEQKTAEITKLILGI